MNKLLFVAWLFVFAGCGLVVGGINFYEVFRFWNDGQSGVMISSDRILERAVKYETYITMPMDVTYLTPQGSVFVSQKFVPGAIVKRLGEGQQIPVRFLKSEPEHVLYDNSELESPWGWLILGVIMLPVAFYALRLIKQEATT